MRRLLHLPLLGIVLATFANAIHAFEFRQLSQPTIVYDAGSSKATPLFILREGTPVELIVALEGWIKVREAGGGLGWVERKAITDRRNVIVLIDNAEVRAQPNANAPLLFSVRRDVLLESLEMPANGWLKVRHNGGKEGYIALKSVWGI